MDLSLDDDQTAVQELFAEFFAKESTTEAVRAAEPLGFSPALWKRLVSLGAPAVAIPLSLGGGGASYLDLVLACQELGRHIAPVPLIETFAASEVLTRVGAGELLNQIAGGSAIATLALTPANDGFLRLVPAGAVATVVVALDSDELVAITSDRVPSQQQNFGSSPLADWAPGFGTRTVLARGTDAITAFQAGRELWMLLMSAALNGIQRAALRIAVDYVQTREAFGRPIGWFQAVQHRLADVAVAGDGAEYLTYKAAWSLDQGRADAGKLAAMALLFSADTSFYTCRESLQFHGGYGFTLEYDIQLFFRRAKAWPLPLGDPARQYQQVAELAYADV